MIKVLSFIKFLLMKIKLGKYLDMCPQNIIKGKVEVIINKDSLISINRGMHSTGPLYLKAVNGGKIKIGRNCFFNHNCSITACSNISIGDNCCFGNNLVVVDHDHNFRSIGNNIFISDEIIIGNNVWIGANVTVLRNTHIGDNCVIGANCVVKGNIESNTIYTENKDFIKRKI
ncbi:acyltransferase [Clostridium perfringens]|uniref:acyltransferase n=1 Tax=Clostridium perfringens TaxID=1502 RepID=UPI0022469270|nr:acyltransferase [Clostridium perfringens]MCX0378911.1 acyltransferase [Clostridium perfringens]